MDAFEARIHFSDMLKILMPSQQSVTNCTMYAIKNRHLQEDFHSVILEVLDAVDLNVRINIFQFVDSLIASGSAIEGRPFVENLAQDLPVILEKVVPVNSSSKAFVNLHSSFHILAHISHELQLKDTKEYEKKFNLNETLDEDTTDPLKRSWKFLLQQKALLHSERYASEDNTELSQESLAEVDADPKLRLYTLSEQQILARMEADRERHKRAKEKLWMVTRESYSLSFNEFENIDDRFSSLQDEDYKELRELKRLVNKSFNGRNQSSEFKRLKA
ncbi:CTD kinase subunit gamma [Komagataella phaffii CBS 7435]|uniref:CID domain-containing protein n=2 Tax=Komagataella phaffii TaxID=460519 RepID=C4R1L6_KOMPG|nr:Hypothetical protein PAS_chr2-1_0740 [Komagataella phaffii GS115]AOA62177.1 GQ67_00807T0 [Komagataella phaffii]CAH2448078.1 CTD kinase subunit gamma [Komagataella phaffii CBS 7435]AOA67032.1 GQ68_00582T0 [Komagataella phaffii GS115]CAY69390.1 Hypothetical protein PAS_chr2-1_0740 [Komagataella phaffii GS115]CCA38223.1 CTD kinase subunit gamma [Komagataella phaffii CBS 7435]